MRKGETPHGVTLWENDYKLAISKTYL